MGAGQVMTLHRSKGNLVKHQAVILGVRNGEMLEWMSGWTLELLSLSLFSETGLDINVRRGLGLAVAEADEPEGLSCS